MKKNAFKVIVIFILFLAADVIQTISTSGTDEKMDNQLQVKAAEVTTFNRETKIKQTGYSKAKPENNPSPSPAKDNKSVKAPLQKSNAKSLDNVNLARGNGKFPTLAMESKGNVFAYGFAKTKTVALTFDDGPDAFLTPKLLDLLKEENIKVSFFLIGNKIDTAPEVVKRAYEEGHLILNHTYTHPKLSDDSNKEMKNEIEETENKIYSLIGKRPAMMRPPFGLTDKNEINTMNELGVKTIVWSLDSLDWKLMNRDKIIDRVVSNVKENDIILMHMDAGKQPTLDAMPAIIRKLKEKGYSFETLDKILKIEAYK